MATNPTNEEQIKTLQAQIDEVEANLAQLQDQLAQLESQPDSTPDPGSIPEVIPGDKLIRQGDSGANVLALQKGLNILGGYALVLDGKFGKNTEIALKNYQSKNNLTADGVAGPKTIQAINAALDSTNQIDPSAGTPWTLKFIERMNMKTKGSFKNNYPQGLIVHYTSGWSNKGDAGAISTIDGGVSDGYAYWCMSTTGTIVKGHDISKWGYHAGASSFPGIGTSVSSSLLGLEMNCGGHLEKTGKTWFGYAPPADHIRTITSKRYPNETTGSYEIYTPEQESALVEFILWLKKNEPVKGHFNLDWVLGHDEVATPKGRKDDPGGSLSMGMPGLREKVKQLAKERGIA